jgi:hypothetical protein
VAGLSGLNSLIADHQPEDASPAELIIGIETDRGPWAQALIATGYTRVCGEPIAGGQVPRAAPHVAVEERPW